MEISEFVTGEIDLEENCFPKVELVLVSVSMKDLQQIINFLKLGTAKQVQAEPEPKPKPKDPEKSAECGKEPAKPDKPHLLPKKDAKALILQELKGGYKLTTNDLAKAIYQEEMKTGDPRYKNLYYILNRMWMAGKLDVEEPVGGPKVFFLKE